VAGDQDGGALRQQTLKGECAKRPVVIRMNAEVASLHDFPVAETVDNVRKQQTLYAMSPMRQRPPAGYQRRQGVTEDVETGEALDVRRVTLRVADRVAVLTMGVQQNAPGGKGPDR
jgi:hypothetical protein